MCFRKFLELKDPISGNQEALNSHIRATWSTWRCDILPDCTRLAICWVIAGSTDARFPLKSPERSLTNSVCAGEDSGKEGGLGVVLELAAAFVDSLMMKLMLNSTLSTVTSGSVWQISPGQTFLPGTIFKFANRYSYKIFFFLQRREGLGERGAIPTIHESLSTMLFHITRKTPYRTSPSFTTPMLRLSF